MAPLALSFGVAGLVVHTAAADQGKSVEHSQPPEHSAGEKQSPGARGNGGGSAEADHSSGNPGTSGDPSSPQPASNADFSGHGANQHGAYDSTRAGSPSQNGIGNGRAVGRPCAGCAGRADNKNPPGQMPDGSDPNAGFECDRNLGIGRTNPAHTGCEAAAPPAQPQPPQPPQQPPAKPAPVVPSAAVTTSVTPVAVPPSPAKAAAAAKPDLAVGADELAITGLGPELLLVGLAALGLGGILWTTSRSTGSRRQGAPSDRP